MAVTTPLLSDQLVELIQLVRSADSVELKITVPERAQRSTIAALGVDPLLAQIRQVFFFDTPDLALNRAGVVVRARRVAGKGDDSVVKLRPVVPDELPADLRASPNLGVEVDAMPGSFVCSASLKCKATPAPVWDVVHGSEPLRRLFTKEQRAFYAAHAPAGLELDELRILGPIFVLKSTVTIPNAAKGRAVGELWLYPDGARILELSTKCAPADTATTLIDARAFLQSRGIETGGDQQTKTKMALAFFAAELASAELSAGEAPAARDELAAPSAGSTPADGPVG